VLFGRYPEAGKTKTRLARELGDEQTLLLYQALLADAAWKGGGLPSCDLIASLTSTNPMQTPPHDPLGREPFASASLIPQRGEGFGQRLANAFCDPFARGYSQVVLIGTDTPELEVADLAGAFRLLADFPVVMGPALDGGYYLIAGNEPCPRLFTDINWSTSTVMAETVAAAKTQRLSVGCVRRFGDVDYLADLRALSRRRDEALLIGAPSPCPGTDAWLEGKLPGQGGVAPTLPAQKE